MTDSAAGARLSAQYEVQKVQAQFASQRKQRSSENTAVPVQGKTTVLDDGEKLQAKYDEAKKSRALPKDLIPIINEARSKGVTIKL